MSFAGSMSSLPHSEGGLSRSLSHTVYPRVSESHNFPRTDSEGFSASLLYKGYLDDPRNTDNAWVEAEVWNFHYDLGEDFDTRLKGVSILTLNAPIATKVVCFSRLLKCLRSLYGKPCGPRSDCSFRSSLLRVHAVCFYT